MVLSLPKCPPRPPPCKSRLNFSLKEERGMHSKSPLKRYPPLIWKSPDGWLPLHLAHNSLNSSSSSYNSMRHSKPTISWVKVINKEALLLKASATLLRVPDLC